LTNIPDNYCRTFWQVGSSATLGTNSHFVGHIFALTSIAAQTGATVQGQLMARNGAVTLDSNTITNGICASAATPAPTAATTAVVTTNEQDLTKTGESSNNLFIGLILLGLSAGMVTLLRRKLSHSKDC